jgi:hypothetical protein
MAAGPVNGIGFYRRCKMATVVYLAVFLVGLVFGAMSLLGLKAEE